jgi:RNA polymerase sigma factor (sigma-70 family)
MCETPGTTSLSDEELFSLYKTSGDQSYFEIIYNRRKEDVRRFLGSRLFPERHDEIDDFSQKVFTELLATAHPCFNNFSLRAWLLQSAESHVFRALRRETAKKRQRTLEDMPSANAHPASKDSPSVEAGQHEIAERVRGMVRRLPPQEQEAIDLTLKGFSRREGAAKLGITPGDFQGRLNRGILELQGMTSIRLEASIT